ncbi:MAG: FAD-dependent oxidoreductase [Hyphomonadaceae bacterium]
MPYDRILDLMSVPGSSRIFVLGAYARRVTIYSQQVRAVNLVDAIQHYGFGLCGRQVAIVGGGAGGLTAAARALVYGGNVTVFEQSASLLSVQSEASHRWVHPHLYEWPVELIDGQLPDNAGLPVLDWSAQNADDLAKHLRTEWAAVARKFGEAVDERRYTAVTKLKSQADGVLVTSKEAKKPLPDEQKFDLVILAVGYGLESDDLRQHSYWQPDGLAWAAKKEEQRLLIAGYGDGALTDLISSVLPTSIMQRSSKMLLRP